jgi:hypothetical protein
LEFHVIFRQGGISLHEETVKVTIRGLLQLGSPILAGTLQQKISERKKYFIIGNSDTV